MRVVTYSRKSQDDPESVEAQTAAARSFCEARGYSIVQEFSDSGVSGGEFANRPGLNALLDTATAKKRSFDALVIRDVDRLERDQFRTAMVLQDITERGVRVFCYGVNDGEEIKLGSFADKMMLSIRTGSADDFRAKTGRDTKLKLHQKALEGHATGTKTFGYDIRRVGHGRRPRTRAVHD